MKSNQLNPNLSSVLASLLLLPGCLFTAHAQSPPPQLRLDRRTNALELTVSSLSATGALFIYQATNLQALVDSPAVLLGTNTTTTNDVRVSITPAGGLAKQSFFSAANWPGLSTADFDEPEEYPFESFPDKILFTSDLPANLGAGSAFIVDFLVTDPSGQPVAISGTATILVVRESDGAAHPDASVTPSSGQMTNGYMRVVITVNATMPLDGYTLGLSIAPGILGLPHPLVSSTFLKAAFGLGAAPLTPPHDAAYWTQKLEERRLANKDAGPLWGYPLAGSGHLVSGTFGEWRGEKTASETNGHVHNGLDLSSAGVAVINVKASRGGVISYRGTLTNMGDYLVIDHGTGWFSRYLHLDTNFISVKIGQAVTNGATLATRLYSPPGWGRHLHFEVRTNQNVSQWNNGLPGIGQDPLQTDGIFPVPDAVSPPQLEEFGLTRQHPGQTAFLKGPPTSAGGPVYLFAKWVDEEGGAGGNRLGLRAMGFLPEGTTLPQAIRPTNETTVDLLRPPGSGRTNGFARYSNDHLNKSIPPSQRRTNYFRYWWLWDTSIYTNAIGSRALLLTGTNYSGTPTSYTFTFGPQIKSNAVALVGQQYWFTNIAYLGTNTIPAFVQPDKYQLQIIQTNGQPLTTVTWQEGQSSLSGSAPVTRLFTVHTNEQAYAFTLPPNTDPNGLKLRVSSLLVTNIAHEIKLAVKATFIITSFVGTPWDGVAVPSTVTATVTSTGQNFFLGSNGKLERGAPLFSTQVPVQVPFTRTFYVCNTVLGFPSRPGGPTVNRLGASSFIAVVDGSYWINASAGAWRINGSTGQITDWEYQLRYSPSDLVTGSPRLQIGTVTGLDVWLGADIPAENYTVTVE